MVTIKEAKETSKHIVNTIRPVAIILFGSVARNGFGEDLDLLIIIDDRFENVNKTHLLLHSAASCKFQVPKDQIPNKFQLPNFNDQNFLQKNARLDW